MYRVGCVVVQDILLTLKLEVSIINTENLGYQLAEG